MSESDESAVPIAVENVDTKRVTAASKILVVDDTPANLVAAEAALAELARPVVTAASGTEALAHLLEDDFALALLDVNMPEMDGYELARLIRARERTQHLPIIFITAHSYDEAAVLQAYHLGAVDFLFRPVPPEVLRAKASVFVALHERNEQLIAERIERDFENRRRDYETEALRRERDRAHAAKQELTRANEALAQHDRRKDSFIAILAHELRNPLASLRTCLDLLKERPAQAPTQKMMGALDRQMMVLTRLVDDLLDVSRMKADKIELRPEPVELAEIVEAALLTCGAQISERRHELVVERSGPVKIVADTIRLAQVVSNLLSNAARYTPPGGRITISIGQVGDLGVVRVSDSGIGIPAELQDTIFDMFVQERVRSDGSGGLGLGLALARRLVEMHDGTIGVTSAGRGQGSTFEVRIPLLGSVAAVPIRKRTCDIEPLRGNNALRARRTLVVDDNDDARELLSDLLRGRGYDVLTAADGASALQLIREQEPDVALVDLGLPVLDGYGVVETLRRECPQLKTRLVALSGYGRSTDRERTKSAGFHAHLVKPATAAAIFACLEQLDRGA